MRLLSVAAVLGSLLSASIAHAQSDFSQVKVKPGDIAYVTEASGVVVSGPLTKISPSALTIDGHEFTPAPGLKIERRGDPLWNGTLIGMAVGAVLGATVGGQGCRNSQECPVAAIFVGGVAFYGAIGAFIDWRIKGRTIIYDTRAVGKPSVRIAPEVTPSRRALGVTVFF